MKKNRQSAEPGDEAESQSPYISNQIFTIPNVLCVVRLVGSFFLIPIALMEKQQVFLWFFIFLAMTDWIDGKIAVLLDQRTVLGARLDSWADATLYAALLVGVVITHGETLLTEILWVILALGSYVISTVAGFWKYQRWPSYHTRAAKTSWFLTLVAVIALFTDWSIWPLRIALAGVAITNIEALCITLISPSWRADVTSIYHAWRDNRRE